MCACQQGHSRLAIPLRRIKVKRDKGGTDHPHHQDLERTAVEIAALYKSRWQIELLFRWIKQHLNIEAHRQQPQRHQLASHRRDDRLSAPASCQTSEFLKMLDLRFRRTVLPVIVHVKSDRRNRQAFASQSETSKPNFLIDQLIVQIC